MDGMRSIHGPRVCLHAALAAAVLLAMSPGTAAAQSTTGVTITGPSGSTVNEGAAATYRVAVEGYAAAGASASTVTVTLTSPFPDTDPPETEGEDTDLAAFVDTVTLQVPENSGTTARKFTGSGTISLTTLHDNDAEDEHFTLEFYVNDTGGLTTDTAGQSIIELPAAGTAGNPNALIIDDDETQGYALALAPAGQTPTETVAFTVDLTASPAHEDGSGTLQVNIDKQSGWTMTLDNNNNAANPTTISGGDDATAVITITQAADGNRVTDTVTVSAWMGVAGAAQEKASLSIDVADANVLQAVTAKVTDKAGNVLREQPKSVKEGETISIAVMPLDKDGKQTTANEKLTVALAPSGSAGAQDYSLSGAIEITAGQNRSNVVDLVVETDEDVGMETLTFDATVSGVPANGADTLPVAGVLSIDIEDATAKKVAPKSDADLKAVVEAAMAASVGDEGLNPGESFTVTASDLFLPPMDGYTARYSASVSAGDVVGYTASGDNVTITALKAGEATVTVTATAREATASATGSQSVSNVAHVEIPLTVTDKALTLTLEAPGAMDGNVVEGKNYDVTVMANRAVLEDTAVTFSHASSSEADARDYSIDGVTIMSGGTTATAKLSVTEDDMNDAGAGMGEALGLYAEGGGAMSNTLELTIWDEAVPALPLIAQLLLALFLTAGGARLYRRRQG